MRNWYSPARLALNNTSSRSAVGHYLWGIDTNSIFRSFNAKVNLSDITYEELIQFFQDHLCQDQTLMSHAVGHYLWGIDTNVRLDGVISSSIRRTLPMRNWYKRQSKKSFPNATCVGHYLWGIDTNSHTTYPNCVKCRTLPMRNWYLIDLETYMSY